MSHYRLNLFIQPEHAKRLDELAAKKGVSKSSIVAAALASWLSPPSSTVSAVFSHFFPSCHNQIKHLIADSKNFCSGNARMICIGAH